MMEPTRQSLCCPKPKHGHTEAQNVKGEEKLPIFTPAEDRTRDPLHVHPNLYRAAIKAGLYRKAVQVLVGCVEA